MRRERGEQGERSERMGRWSACAPATRFAAGTARLALAVGCLLVAGHAGTAGGAVVDVVLDGTITSATGLGTFVGAVGDPISVTISLEGSTADYDPSPDRFESGLAGSVTAPLLIDVPVSQVVADAGAGSWVATGSKTILNVPVVFTILMSGTGLLAGQVLPRFDQIVGALATYTTTGNGNIDVAAVQFDTVTIIPEPGTAALTTLGFAYLGAARRRASSRRAARRGTRD